MNKLLRNLTPFRQHILLLYLFDWHLSFLSLSLQHFFPTLCLSHSLLLLFHSKLCLTLFFIVKKSIVGVMELLISGLLCNGGTSLLFLTSWNLHACLGLASLFHYSAPHNLQFLHTKAWNLYLFNWSSWTKSPKQLNYCHWWHSMFVER